MQALAKSANSLFLGGYFTVVNNVATRQRLAAVDTTQPTNNVMAFDPAPNNAVMALASDGATLFAGGSFSALRSGLQSNVTRFTIPSVGFTRWTEGNNAASIPVAIDDRLLVGDVDTQGLSSATVAITSDFSPTEDSLSFTADPLTMGNIAVTSQRERRAGPGQRRARPPARPSGRPPCAR